MQTEIVSFRLGQPDDLLEVQEICKDVWDGHDYMPSIWLELLNEATTRTFVAEVEGKMAGFYCLGLQINEVDRAGWWRGVRVSSAFKGQGLANRMLEHALDESRRLKLDTLRYGTGETNVPMHRVAERYGLRFVAPYSYLSAKIDLLGEADNSNTRPLRPNEFETVWQFIQASADWQRGEGLHCDAWTWRKLNPTTIRTMLEHGWVYGSFEDQRLKALTLTVQDDQPEVHDIFVTWLDGSPDGVKALVSYLGKQLARKGQAEQLEMMLFQDEARDQMLKDLGFQSDPGDWMRVYELGL